MSLNKQANEDTMIRVQKLQFIEKKDSTCLNRHFFKTNFKQN